MGNTILLAVSSNDIVSYEGLVKLQPRPSPYFTEVVFSCYLMVSQWYFFHCLQQVFLVYEDRLPYFEAQVPLRLT